ncbi:unnamed protein product [Oppiella nova]|uniref:Iron-sulfur cluster assembly 2 homolog, mitochondrial n=1 Tax=Oppiella nova TaxID=334625 RepID=A0A7R9MA86_9ACAR|nr:unnamed protein product [Oppiella nova]CAG2173411.1 unnamed protein product [Oppiella nova]
MDIECRHRVLSDVFVFSVRTLTTHSAVNHMKTSSQRRHAETQTASSETIEISDNCVKQVKKVMDKSEDMLRVEVFSGGCSGLQYRFDMTDKTTAEDVVFSRNGVKVVVDRESLSYMKGSTVDYSSELIRSAFRVVDNPLSQQGCSCGASFALKVDNGFKLKT